MALRIFTYPNSFRVQKALIAAQYNNISIELPKFEVGKDNKTAEFTAKNPTQKVPVLELPSGETIFESNAIARYVARLRLDTGLLGSSAVEQGQVDQWIDFSTNEIEPSRAVWLYQVLGYLPANPKALEEAKKEVDKTLALLDSFLLSRTFFVGNQVTLADITIFVALLEPVQKLFAPKFIEKYTNLIRWFNTVANQKEVAAVVGKVQFAKEEAKPAAAAGKGKEAKPAAKKEEKKEEKKPAAAEEDDEPRKETKPKSILDTLPESPMGHIDTTKKLMFSERPILPDFFEKHWPQFDPAGYTWYVMKYNYNSDNKVLFMTGNAIGGFIQRSDAVRKYALGVMNIYGNPDEETPPFKISGAWMFRGNGIPKEMTEENPDSEYYTWTKIDTTTEEGRQAVKEQFMAEKLDGETVLDRRYFK